MTGRGGQTILGRVKGFTLCYDGFDPAHEGLREALTSTGNGYFCARGAAEWEEPSEAHYAATYGSLIRTRYGEPFLTTEMMRVDDVGSLEVATF